MALMHCVFAFHFYQFSLTGDRFFPPVAVEDKFTAEISFLFNNLATLAWQNFLLRKDVSFPFPLPLVSGCCLSVIGLRRWIGPNGWLPFCSSSWVGGLSG